MIYDSSTSAAVRDRFAANWKAGGVTALYQALTRAAGPPAGAP